MHVCVEVSNPDDLLGMLSRGYRVNGPARRTQYECELVCDPVPDGTATATSYASDDCGCGPFGDPEVWELTMSGFVGWPGLSDNISLLNGTHNLVYQGKMPNGPYCFWAKDLGGDLSPTCAIGSTNGHGSWLVLVSDGYTREVQFFCPTSMGYNNLFYYRNFNPWVCFGANQMVAGPSFCCQAQPFYIDLVPG